jgi:apolipoprotein N-acyltransferase
LAIASFPPFDYSIVAWFGLAPFVFVLRQRGLLEASVFGSLFGSLFGIGTFYWACNVPGINLPSFLLFLFAFSVFFAAFGFLYRLMSRRIGNWIIVGAPMLWVSLEYVRSNLFFLSWPWNLLAHSQYQNLPAIQIADITGVYGISFIIVMVNQFLSQIPDFLTKRRFALFRSVPGQCSNIKWVVQLTTVSIVLLLTVTYGWYKLSLQDGSRYIRVAIIQANLLTQDNMSFDDQLKHLEEYGRLTREAAQRKPSLIVWPAASLPAPFSNRLVRYLIEQLVQETGTYLLVGGAGHEKYMPKKAGYMNYSNSEFLISPSGLREKQYNKMRLLPFNEYLPLKGVIRWPKWITTLQEDFLPGKELTLFTVSGTLFGAPICWENMFPDLFRRFVKEGAQFMVSVTNEGFLSSTAGPRQTLAINIFRAVENRVFIARAATTGISAFISSDGKVVERVKDGKGKDLLVAGILVRDIPLLEKKTFYTIYGDIFAYIAIGITAIIVIASLFIGRAP